MGNPISGSTQKLRQGDLKAVCDILTGGRGVVRLLRGGEEFTHRMVAQGIMPGVEVTVVQNYGRGPVVVAVKDTHITLGWGESLKVLVEML